MCRNHQHDIRWCSHSWIVVSGIFWYWPRELEIPRSSTIFKREKCGTWLFLLLPLYGRMIGGEVAHLGLEKGQTSHSIMLCDPLWNLLKLSGSKAYQFSTAIFLSDCFGCPCNTASDGKLSNGTERELTHTPQSKPLEFFLTVFHRKCCNSFWVRWQTRDHFPVTQWLARFSRRTGMME